MKRAIVICPDKRAILDDLAGDVPLVLAVYLGKPFVDHALHGLAVEGFTEVILFASDRPAELREYVGTGSTWGMQVEVIATPRELTPEEGAARAEVLPGDQLMVLDRLPQAPHVAILDGPAAWHESRAQLLHLLAPGQVGVRERAPGVWVGMKTRIAGDAVLEAPCWIGHQATISAGAHIGPRSYVENDSLVEVRAEIGDSTVGARTYLGSMTHLARSIAAGPVLANWSNGSVTRLTDAFLLSRLDPVREAAASPFGRLLALGAMLLTFWVPLLALLLAPIRRRPWREFRQATLKAGPGEPLRPLWYAEFPALPGGWKRWPRLCRVVTGHFSWTGNPPIEAIQAAQLVTEFERLWLQVPPAVFTAPEAEGCAEPWDDEARAHAALFASRPTFAWRWRILRHGLTSLFLIHSPHTTCTPNPAPTRST
ncbi:hypothetical protein [Haloferula sargassicola]|uniref:Bacterial sugar transferase domain-containing protein n=1 Tax=Haloferula sargassicola TaxID=490096 RepID=A0ABP9UMW0_9BACT